ncbi:pilus assembly protein [Paraburkholderia sp. B3]|uniref:pilus assembly protein n=1 Tax=Paraburkholderia sp. B3 TaxID=3134791 RepID=UPI003981FB93
MKFAHEDIMNHIVTRRAPAARGALAAAACMALVVLAACASKEQGYGVGPQAQAELQMRDATRDPAPDTPGMYLGLIQRMQAEGLYYASLAHIDAYEHQYGASPESIVLRADALRATGQSAASATAYMQLLTTPFAARGHRGLGLLAGAAGDFSKAASELAEASRLEPTDATTLSDLGYALLREGEVAAARVPLLKAVELDTHNPKIVANVALYFVASGDAASAQALMAQEGLAPAARAAIERDAQNVAQAQHAREMAHARAALASAAMPAPTAAMASTQSGWPGGEAQPRLVERSAQ